MKRSDVFTAIDICKRALPVWCIAPEFSNIFVAIGVRINTLSIEKAFLKSSDVFITGELSIGSPGFTRLSRLLTCSKLPYICTCISVGIDALSLEQVVPKQTDICIAVGIAILALTVLLIVLERSDITITVGIRKCALTVLIIILE